MLNIDFFALNKVILFLKKLRKNYVAIRLLRDVVVNWHVLAHDEHTQHQRQSFRAGFAAAKGLSPVCFG